MASRVKGQCVARMAVPIMSTVMTHTPAIHNQRGTVRRDGVAGLSISMLAALQLAFLVALPLGGQTWDVGSHLADYVPSHTDGRLRIGFEQRFRYEFRGGNAFGAD